MASTTLKCGIFKSIATDTTSTAGLLTTTVPFDEVIGVTFATAGMNYYAFPRRANSGVCAVYIVDSSFRPVTNTQVSVNVWRKP